MFRGLEGTRSVLIGTCTAVLGVSCAFAALYGSLQHPVAPILATVLLMALITWIMWKPAHLWFVLPALLPVANFAPWTGWWLVDESDLLVLAVMGGGYLRWAADMRRRSTAASRRMSIPLMWVCMVLLLQLLLGVWRGLDDARGAASWSALFADLWLQGPYGDYDLPGNTLRVAKSLLCGLLLAPVLCRSSEGSLQWLARGMLTGLCFVGAAVLWERWLYVGWLDFTTGYRTVAWFWEMHVGGGAIDAYMAMALPFAWWAAWSAPRGWRWYAAAALVLLATYGVLTTYSRGLYLTVVITALCMAALAYKYHLKAPGATTWHRRAMTWLLIALVVEIMGVWTGGVVMSDRLVQSNADLYQRMAHWKRGVNLLQTPAQWTFGLGAGRLPAHYSAQTAEGALPGRVRWVRKDDGHVEAWLFGPARHGTKGEWGVAQRVALAPGGGYTVRIRAHLDAPVWLKVQLCEQHLLYTADCQLRTRQVGAGSKPAGGWFELPLLGPAFASDGMLSALRDGVFTIKVLQPHGLVRISEVQLLDPEGRQLLKNSNFARGPHNWSTIAYSNFLPWHMDNLPLELLIERGLLGLMMLGTVVVSALVLVLRQARSGSPLALVVGGAIMAVTVAGAVISVTEIPRVSLVVLLLLVVSFCICDNGSTDGGSHALAAAA